MVKSRLYYAAMRKILLMANMHILLKNILNKMKATMVVGQELYTNGNMKMFVNLNINIIVYKE